MKLYSYFGKFNAAGQQVRVARENAHLSQEQLAAKLQLEGLGVSQKTISRIAHGQRVIPDYELIALSKVLHVSVTWLLGIEKEDA